jgi:hypothetical protein
MQFGLMTILQKSKERVLFPGGIWELRDKTTKTLGLVDSDKWSCPRHQGSILGWNKGTRNKGTNRSRWYRYGDQEGKQYTFVPDLNKLTNAKFCNLESLPLFPLHYLLYFFLRMWSTYVKFTWTLDKSTYLPFLFLNHIFFWYIILYFHFPYCISQSTLFPSRDNIFSF